MADELIQKIRNMAGTPLNNYQKVVSLVNIEEAFRQHQEQPEQVVEDVKKIFLEGFNFGRYPNEEDAEAAELCWKMSEAKAAIAAMQTCKENLQVADTLIDKLLQLSMVNGHMPKSFHQAVNEAIEIVKINQASEILDNKCHQDIHDAVVHGLRHYFSDHGYMTPADIGSATKRIMGKVKVAFQLSSSERESGEVVSKKDYDLLMDEKLYWKRRSGAAEKIVRDSDYKYRYKDNEIATRNSNG